MPKARPLSERFWEKVEKSDGCWLWKAALNHGYGVIGEGGKHGRILIAPRVSWELHHGPIPDGMHVLHNCPGGDNKACVNPDHLFLGTHAINMGDASAKRQFRPHRRYTEAEVMDIRTRHAAGATQDALAAEYRTRQGHIRAITTGRQWGDLPVLVSHGRRRGESHRSAKLTADGVRAIRLRIAAGEPNARIAADHGVSVYAINDIAAGRTWKHVA